jgi:hypothetical protein
MAIIQRATVSRIWLIHDHDGEGGVIKWFEIGLEVPDNKHVQTMEMTVNYDDQHQLLEEFLDLNGFAEDAPAIRYFHQGHGIGHGEIRDA